MIMTQQQQQEISELVVACETYWLLRGISASTREEMKLELKQHLEQAIADGKSIESVVGANPHTFAESWAREMHVHVLTGDLLPRLVSSILMTIAGFAVLEHLIHRSLSFSLTFGIVTTVLILTLASFSGHYQPF